MTDFPPPLPSTLLDLMNTPNFLILRGFVRTYERESIIKDMTRACTIPGNPELYGMGIRVSFYLLWFFVLVGERCHEQHAQVLRGVELVLAYAVFLGLAIAASGGDLFAAEVYIALLLISTTVYLLVPRHTADLMAWIRPDLGVGAQRSGCGFIGTVRFLFVLIVIGLHLWFWGTGVESTSIDRISRDQSGCAPSVQVGFAFGPIDLHNGGFRAMNVLLMLALLAGGVAIGAMKAGLVGSKESRRRRKVKYGTVFLAISVNKFLRSTHLLTPTVGFASAS